MSVDDVAEAYDAVAGTYDAAVAGDAWIRRRLWQHYRRVFRPGSHLIDLFCGTGIDATFLAEHGMYVVGLDASAGMIAECRRKVAERGLGNLVEARHTALTDLASLTPGSFDGALSAFGGLNTVADLGRLSGDLARVLRPGSHLVAHFVNRFSLWEAFGYLARGEISSIWRLARRNQRAFSIGGRSIRHYVYGPAETYARFFAADFELTVVYGQGILRPPHTLRRVPPVVAEFAARVERSIDSWPLVRGCGRFFVLDLERR